MQFSNTRILPLVLKRKKKHFYFMNNFKCLYAFLIIEHYFDLDKLTIIQQ